MPAVYPASFVENREGDDDSEIVSINDRFFVNGTMAHGKK
jgi:hypothetical protein